MSADRATLTMLAPAAAAEMLHARGVGLLEIAEDHHALGELSAAGIRAKRLEGIDLDAVRAELRRLIEPEIADPCAPPAPRRRVRAEPGARRALSPQTRSRGVTAMEMIANGGGKPSSVRIHSDLIQGTEEWLAARCGMLTASEMKLIVTPTLKVASNDKERSHLYELLAQRITNYVEPRYVSDDMLRGRDDEVDALVLYDKHFARVERVGFITNDKWGFTLGYSPDAIVGTDGLVECKSRVQKYQVETFVVHVVEQNIPSDFLIQAQTGLLVAERLWLDFVSYSGGLPMAPIRVYPDDKTQDAIVSASQAFEQRLADNLARYRDAVASSRAIPTKRIIREILV